MGHLHTYMLCKHICSTAECKQRKHMEKLAQTDTQFLHNVLEYKSTNYIYKTFKHKSKLFAYMRLLLTSKTLCTVRFHSISPTTESDK